MAHAYSQRRRLQCQIGKNILPIDVAQYVCDKVKDIILQWFHDKGPFWRHLRVTEILEDHIVRWVEHKLQKKAHEREYTAQEMLQSTPKLEIYVDDFCVHQQNHKQ